eukprot:CAMPEP_0117014786 /NCGR_PEP_ID=MMETSP0472-20121206/11930_1 /TAXON_ID=693140 ORGANISM="Tiarina fusus, Strain LIS" /NCGR_SAMPLE_ID=MMETSP0472 /ASSEMBLY_ACC=CAM_ASM_000603 /LENGTH=458 /DNA_ID=CAMNT_0004718431 /DNA_START=204 /DNA_END=1580 /DNA_ORIENTATION=-
MKDLEKELRIKDDIVIREIPAEGWTQEQILELMEKLEKAEEHKWKTGKVSGCVYHGGDDHTNMMSKVFSLFALTNPLHPDVFPSIRKFESEIIGMTAEMLGNVPGVCGALTSGGTESILMACKAHRDFYLAKGITQPEMIVADSAHVAFHKASHYFGIKLVVAPSGDDYCVDVAAMEKLITRNTVLLVGSAPSYAHGMVDDITAIAALAKKRGIGCHVDACLGGYLLPWLKQVDGFQNIPDFDFRVDGVTSMSADTHKYGYSVKGTSVILFRNEHLRRSMFYVNVNWNGGIYASPTIAGSRPGALVATTWASLMGMGKKGYLEAAASIAKMQQEIKQGIMEMDDLELVGDSTTMVLAFKSEKYNIFGVKTLMGERGWNLNPLQKPNSIHICITYNQARQNGGEKFMNDLKESMDLIRADPKKYEGVGDAYVYGLAYGLPDRSLIEEMIMGYLDLCLTP